MKKSLTYIVLILVSSLSVSFLFVRRSTAVPLKFNKKDLPQHGLVIVRQSDAELEQLRMRVRSNAVGDDDGAPQCFIKNLNTHKRVIAYTLKWEMTTDDGRVITRVRRETRQDILEGKEGLPSSDERTTLLPQTARYFSLFGYGDGQQVDLKGIERDAPAQDNRELLRKVEESGVRGRLNAQLQHTVSVTLSIDGALFDDGNFVGDNTTSHYERMKAQADVKRSLVREIYRRLKNAESYESVMKSIQDRSSELSAFAMTPAHDAKPEDIIKHYQKLYLDQILEMKAGFGSDESALRQFLWVNYNNQYLTINKSQ